MKQKKALHYKDVFLEPTYFDGSSRDDIVLNGDYAVPANMAATIDLAMAERLADAGRGYIMHRFLPYREIINWAILMNHKNKKINLSIGVKEQDKQLVKDLFDEYHLDVQSITIDIAHGHCRAMKEMIAHIRLHDDKVKIIGGNISTTSALNDLAQWGCNEVKVGLSMGRACTTYNNTGIGSPMFSTILQMKDFQKHSSASAVHGVQIIADGGIREIGDICKALAAGADRVMAGSIFAACVDSPTEHLDGKALYYGSASCRNKGDARYVEGSEGVFLPENGLTYLQLLDKIDQGVRSFLSYAGKSDIKELRDCTPLPFGTHKF